MIKISVLHPSRGRSKLARQTCEEWSLNAKYPKNIEYFLGIDEEDLAAIDYKKEFENLNHEFGLFELSINPTNSIPSASNFLIKKISETTELIIGISDDSGCLKDWDENLLNIIKDNDNFKNPKFIRISGGFDGNIINRAYYNKLGYMLYPEYDGCFADEDAHKTAIAMGCYIVVPDIVIEHRHYTVGTSNYDSTYDKHNNRVSFEKNRKIFLEREKRNFDII